MGINTQKHRDYEEEESDRKYRWNRTCQHIDVVSLYDGMSFAELMQLTQKFLVEHPDISTEEMRLDLSHERGYYDDVDVKARFDVSQYETRKDFDERMQNEAIAAQAAAVEKQKELERKELEIYMRLHRKLGGKVVLDARKVKE